MGVALFIEVAIPFREVKFCRRGRFIVFSALSITECVGVEVVDAEVKDGWSMICEAPAGVSERSCEYRAYTSLGSDQDVVDVTDAL